MARRRAVVLVLSGLLLAGLATGAEASVNGRHCQAYGPGGNTSSSWRFDVCVQLVHDTDPHSWYTEAWMTAQDGRTDLFIHTIRLYDQYGLISTVGGPDDFDNQAPANTGIGRGYRLNCISGEFRNLKGRVVFSATYPNGVPTDNIYLDTYSIGAHIC